MELPSFYRTFLRNIFRHMQSDMPMNKKQPSQIRLANSLKSGLLILLCSLVPFASAEIYPLNDLKQDIVNFLTAEYKQTPHQRIEINVSNLDSRLRLARCTDSMEFINQDHTGLGGNISVKVQCDGGKIWSIHVPAQVTIYREITIAGRDIMRGEVIGHAHLTSSLVNVSNIRQAFLPDAKLVIGKEAKRNIGKGEPFRETLLDAPTAVKRGELVTLESLAGSIKVSSSGTAMANGRIGQKIRVRNNSSDRVISGIVISRGLVQTL
ncbi:flagellar basal body P-ring formation chaperone FlgA [Cellvibrio sp. OA-2007]|uniref:flagellar basal body P-ring formation chaperone FlgA n=1 Tax=Cellvibrio sp. OA-2007 TaxID=529823 RepID=UPI000782C369|nr:flagellar basal body P-ring formation chaperone FlgA [Cellvibrio sp. OA-2007]